MKMRGEKPMEMLTINISTTNRRFAMKMPESECYNKFEELVRVLMGSENKKILAPLNERPPIEQWPEEPANAAMMRGIPTTEDLKIGYTGFIYAVCEHCGEARGFCSKYEMTTYKCDKCGEYSDLENLKRMYVHCECGRTFRYNTNATAETFDFPCLDCGMPVPIKFNRKKNVYETMK
jgi:predicted RNA-binding Zn-ribbon protein involved in translation (DUF1610 family)